MAKVYKHKSFKGTEAMVEFLNSGRIQPKQIVAVSFDGEWRTVVYWEEGKSE